MGSQSLNLVKDLMKFESFKTVVDKSHTILMPHGFSVYDLFYKSNENTFKSITNVTITIIIVQVIYIITLIHNKFINKYIFINAITLISDGSCRNFTVNRYYT